MSRGRLCFLLKGVAGANPFRCPPAPGGYLSSYDEGIMDDVLGGVMVAEDA